MARLREAGAVLFAKTNVPEFTLHGYTDNALFGPTRNPWDLELTPGGSSGGAVVAVACGIGPVALATDGGGSIRRPCAHTGLVGFKPSRGVIRRGGGFPPILRDFEVVGPIARSVDDVVVAMSILADDRWTFAMREEPKPRAARRILFAPTFGDAPVDPIIADAVEAVAVELARQGHAVTEAGNFSLAAKMEDIWPVISSVGLSKLVLQHENAPQLIGPLAAEIASRGASYSELDLAAALEEIAELDRAFESLFSDFDFLLTPATAAMPWAATQSHPTTISGQPVGPRGHAIFTPFANAIGLPAISLPRSVVEGRMPIGFQLCAARNRDLDLLRFAGDYMKLGGHVHRWPIIGTPARTSG